MLSPDLAQAIQPKGLMYKRRPAQRTEIESHGGYYKQWYPKGYKSVLRVRVTRESPVGIRKMFD